MHALGQFDFPQTTLLMGDAMRNYSDAAMEDRSGKRTNVEILAHLRQAGRSGFPVIIRNLSISGFVCDGISAMKAGARCFVRIPGYESMGAHVIWNDGFMIGVAFNRLLAQPVVDVIADTHPAKPD